MSALLATIVGLMLVFLVFAIVVSGVVEWWAHFRGHRGRFLLMGLRRLVDDESILPRLLQHPLIGGLYRSHAARSKPPSYVDPRQFALAVADVVVRRQVTAGAVNPAAGPPARDRHLSHAALLGALRHLDGQRSPLASALLPVVDRANGDLDAALDGIAAWFNVGMDRVSGWYKGYAQRRLLVIGFLVALLANVDAIALFGALNRSPVWRDALLAEAEAVVRTGKIGDIAIESLSGRVPTDAERATAVAELERLFSLEKVAAMPIGYACLSVAAVPPADATRQSTWDRCVDEFARSWHGLAPSAWLQKLLGIVLTALAGVLGAPFWFAAMSKVVNLRGSGPPPKAATA